jgi:hypothetical protein
MGKWVEVGDLEGKSLKIITKNGRDGIIQSKLWKELDLNSREGSRVAITLEKRSLIKRVKFFENGHWSYRLLPSKPPVNIKCIESAPCLSCPVEHMCSVDSLYSPHSCRLVEDWITISSLNSTQIMQKNDGHAGKESEKPNRNGLMAKVSKNKRKTKSGNRRTRISLVD